MGKFSGVLLATDVDGTLVDAGVLSAENANAIRSFIAEGGQFTVATGRTPQHVAEHYMPALAVNAPMIAVNGTVIADEKNFDNILWEQKMPCVHAQILRKATEAHSIENAMVYRFDETVSCMEQIPAGEFYKILLVTKTPQDAVDLKNKLVPLFPECHFSRSWETGLEATHVQAGKGVALQKLKEITGAKITVGMGNFENDLTLLQAADFAVAVSNAGEDVKKIADFVTEGNATNGVAELIRKLPKLLKLKKAVTK